MTIPHKQAVVAACDEADGDAVNTLVFRARPGARVQHRPRDPGRDRRQARLRDRRRRSRARASCLRSPTTRGVFSRSGDWPPDAEGCDLIVNATPVRDELLVRPRAGQTVVDLAYARRRIRDRAGQPPRARAGCEVVDGLEALVRQGAKSFELWTGLRAPVEVMRAALASLGFQTMTSASRHRRGVARARARRDPDRSAGRARARSRRRSTPT